jgi:rod shape determining protein RodA
MERPPLAERPLPDSFDFPTLVAALALSLLGVVAIASATHADPTVGAVWKAQVVWLLIALVVLLVIVAVDYHTWADLALAAHAVVAALLVLVLFFGREVGGNKSWLVLGPIRLQPSELAKWTTCLSLAGYVAGRVRGFVTAGDVVRMGLLVGVPMGLTLLQPDTGTALTFVPMYVVALLIGGLRWRVVVVAAVIAVLLAPVLWMQLEGYQRERVLTVLDPDRDPSGVGYQVRQSKIAVGSGGWTGKGLFAGTQSQLNFLPAKHTDFVLAVVAEELGFVGSAVVVGLFYFLFWRGIRGARASQDRLGSCICLLVVAWLAGQFFVNVGMVLGVLPTIGVPLPLMSYGGSALMAAFAGVALVVNVQSRRFVN